MVKLEEIPNDLKPLTSLLKTANDHEKADFVITYWCRFYAIHLGLRINSTGKEAMKFLGAIMALLEKTKADHKSNEAITNDIVAQAHIENYATKLFNRADVLDRQGKADWNVTKLYFTASHIFETLSVFGELTEEVSRMIKYAKWRATYIRKCLKMGETPLPPDNNDSESSNQVNNSESNNETNDDKKDESSNPYIPSPTTPVKEIPASNDPHTWNAKALNGTPLSPLTLIQAQKFCKWAGNALHYEDVETAVTNLEKALELLKTGSSNA